MAARRVEVDAIVQMVTRGLDKLAADFGKVRKGGEEAEKGIKAAGDAAASADDKLERIGQIANDSGLKLASMDARAEALRGEMKKLAADMAAGVRPVEAAVRAYDELEKELKQTEKQMKDTGDSGDGLDLTLTDLWAGLEIGIRGFQAVAGAAEVFWGTLQEGAQAQAAANVFSSLSASIGTTAEAFLGQLRPAAQGTIDDLTLMEGANRFVAMGLANSTTEAAKLTTVASQLGLAFRGDAAAGLEEFALLLANQSLQRLDSFGISAGTVRSRILELQEATPGLSREMAFMTATMEQAEVTMGNIGDQTDGTAGAMARLETTVNNVTTAMQIAFAEGIEPLLAALGDGGDLEAFATAAGKVGSTISLVGLQMAVLGDESLSLREKFTILKDAQAAGQQENTFWTAGAKDAGAMAEFLSNTLQELHGDTTAAAAAMGPLTQEQFEAQNAFASTGEAVEGMTEELDEAAIAAREAEARQQALDETLLRTTGAIGDNRRGWEMYEPAVEEATSTVERFDVALANSQSRLAAQRAELEASRELFNEYAESVIESVLATGEFDAAALDTATSATTLNDIMYEAAAAAGADAESLVLLKVATGELSLEQANAVLQAAAMQAKAVELGEAIAAGTVTFQEAALELQNFQASLDGVNTIAAVSALNDLETIVNRLDGKIITITAVVNGSGGVGITDVGSGATLDSGLAPGDLGGGPAGGGGTPSGGFTEPGGDSLTPPGFAAGGVVTGGVPGRDSVLARLTPGEVVLNRRQQQAVMGGGRGNTFNVNFDDRLMLSHFLHTMRDTGGRNDIFNPDQRVAERGRVVNANS